MWHEVLPGASGNGCITSQTLSNSLLTGLHVNLQPTFTAGCDTRCCAHTHTQHICVCGDAERITFWKPRIDEDLFQLNFSFPSHPQGSHVEPFVITEANLCLLPTHSRRNGICYRPELCTGRETRQSAPRAYKTLSTRTLHHPKPGILTTGPRGRKTCSQQSSDAHSPGAFPR